MLSAGDEPFGSPDRPRRVPWRTAAVLLLGGQLNQFGWCFLAFLPAMLAVVRYHDVNYAPVLCRVQEPIYASASITAVEHVRGKSRPYGHSFTFTDPQAGELTGVSFAKGPRLAPGQTATVQYPPGHPEWAYIVDMWPPPPNVWFVWSPFFPSMVGLVLLVLGVRRAVRACRLLARGRLTTGVLTDHEPPVRGARYRLHRLTFSFSDAAGQAHEVRADTESPGPLLDEERERLVHDPLKPRRALLLDHLPGRPQLGPDGDFVAAPVREVVLRLILPGLTVAGVAIYLLATRV